MDKPIQILNYYDFIDWVNNDYIYIWPQGTKYTVPVGLIKGILFNTHSDFVLSYEETN